MEVGIIGSGNIGGALASYLTDLGHDVIIGNSRGPETLTEVAEKTGAKPVTSEEAAAAKDLVIIAVPAKAIVKLPVEVLSATNAIIVDTGNYYPSRDGSNSDIEAGLTDSEWVSKVLGHPVVKAFNNIVAPSLASKATVQGSENRIALSVAGNEDDQKQQVMKLIDEIGFDVIDGGSLSESWKQQPGMPAYCQDLVKDALKKALDQADIATRANSLAKADEMARPYF